MNDFLNEGKLTFDSPKYDKMQLFLNHILTIVKNNPNLVLSSDVVYSQMKICSLKKTDFADRGIAKTNKHLFQTWIDRFKNIQNISVFNSESWKYWCQFVNERPSEEYIKLYIPIDSVGLEKGVNDIFEFIAKNNICHCSKVARDLRNDNVIVRLVKGDEESLRKILDYINNNEYIQNHLNETNPFIPCINGIGVMNETGISYNDEMAQLISRFINERKNNQSIDIKDFLDFADKNIYRKEVYEAFKNASKNEKQYFDANADIKGIVKRKEEFNKHEKQSLLNDAIKYTYLKYGKNQIITALTEIIENGNYGYVTDANRGLRGLLKNNVSKNEVKQMIEDTLKQFNKKQYTSLEEMISDYCGYYLNDTLVRKLDNMCQVTLNNYDVNFLIGAIKQFLISGKSVGFSRYRKNSEDKHNYREDCKYFDSKTMTQTIKRSLILKGINLQDYQNTDITSLYANILNNSDYKKHYNL